LFATIKNWIANIFAGPIIEHKNLWKMKHLHEWAFCFLKYLASFFVIPIAYTLRLRGEKKNYEFFFLWCFMLGNILWHGISKIEPSKMEPWVAYFGNSPLLRHLLYKLTNFFELRKYIL
jgi:hypothetical protein